MNWKKCTPQRMRYKVIKHIEWKLGIIKGFYYNVEVFSVENGMINLVGWLFHTDKKVDMVELEIIGGDEEKVFILNYGFLRKDVGEGHKTANAYASGFQCKLLYKTACDFRLRLKVNMEGRTKRIDLGTVKANCTERECFDVELDEQDAYKIVSRYLVAEDYKDYVKMAAGRSCDIVIPVYNGVQYLDKLFEGVVKTTVFSTIYIVNDCSTDSEVLPKLKAFAAEYPDRVVLIENEKNLGFVGSVNKALEMTKNDVALVNTDVELPEKWLERLMYPIFKWDDVASTTPYSNSATIFSFPNMGENNLIYHNLDVQVIDEVFRQMNPVFRTVPTGMGFCMGMSRKAIQKVGILDYETFSKGYGEENDWCQRAIREGFRNVQVENLFVYHKHGGSFASDEKKRLMETNLAVLRKRYPTYDQAVAEYCGIDPNSVVRHLVQLLLDTRYVADYVTLAFDHSMGGGAAGYLNRRMSAERLDNRMFLVIRYDYLQNLFSLEVKTAEYAREYVICQFDNLITIAKWLHIDEILVNELVSFPQPQMVLQTIMELKSSMRSCRLTMLFHDFYSLCPTINLLKKDLTYCGLPQDDSCANCYKQFAYDGLNGCATIGDWQKMWGDFLAVCDEVIVFSEDSRDKVQKVFGNLPQLSLVPHKVTYLSPLDKRYKTTDTLNVACLGELTIHKGLYVVRNILELLEKTNGITLSLIGSSVGKKKGVLRKLKETGRYDVSELPEIILKNDIDMFLIPSIWPETFSYTAEEVMQIGLPVVCFNLGAPAERVGKYDKGMIIPEMTAESALETIQKLAEKLDIMNPERRVTQGKKVLFFAEKKDYATRYRAQHLQEQMIRKGINSELYMTAELEKVLPQIAWDEVSKVVIYRCLYKGKMKNLIAEAKSRGIPVLYDVDDYVFDYAKIADLPFMQDEEYKDFEQYTIDIRNCMEQADAFITSTNSLKKAIEDTFPDKAVYLNRNTASEQMWILAQKALEEKEGKKHTANRVVLGYFSGSHTHNGDFARIAQPLLDCMMENNGIYLKVVGCLNLPEEFKKVEERIESVGFVDWMQLPALIASTDINLMPLENTFFHSCKSENKWMEAAMVKVPTIASYNDELAACTCDGEDIILCKDEDEWKAALERLVGNAKARNKIGEKAFEHVWKEKRTCNLTKDIC